MSRIKRMLPTRFKIWLRETARLVVGVDGERGDVETHLTLLDQKVERVYSAIDYRTTEMRTALEQSTDARLSALEQRLGDLEQRLAAIEPYARADDADEV